MLTAFFDIDTQFDFLLPSGALSVPGAERIIGTVSRLNRFAAANGIPLVSTMDAHAENDPEFRSWPPHCVAGTLGQHKPDETLLERRVVIPNRDDAFDIAGAQQIVVEKQSVDVFQTRTIPRLLALLHAGRFVVYGVVTEVCVLHAVRGLLKTGKPVTVVTDAIQSLSIDGSQRALAEIEADGGNFSLAAAITG
ncbi:MAG TPA: cysteine hydrolase family protein [Verrucomicrobiae bacterium]|nr:cysteine hydrolase family protein [Verrucomicrobiae bacterium]